MKKIIKQTGISRIQLIVVVVLLAVIATAFFTDRASKAEDAKQHEYMREHSCGTVNTQSKEQIYKCDNGTWSWSDLRKLKDA